VDDTARRLAGLELMPTKRTAGGEAAGWFAAAVAMLSVAWVARAGGDQWWPEMAVVGLVCDLLGVRAMARAAREREAVDKGEGAESWRVSGSRRVGGGERRRRRSDKSHRIYVSEEEETQLAAIAAAHGGISIPRLLRFSHQQSAPSRRAGPRQSRKSPV
jgi:hypothetical protein